MPTLTRDRLITGFGASRVALGVSAIVVPGLVGRAFGIGGDNRPASRYLGGRDLVLGLGILAAQRAGRADWLLGAGLVDVIDAGATAVAGRRGDMDPRHARAVVLLAGSNAVVALALAVAAAAADQAGGP